MQTPPLSLVISVGDRPELLRRLLLSLEAQRLPAGSPEILFGRPTATENLSCVRNRLYRQSRAPVVYFLDEDCELPDSGFLQRIINQVEARRGCVGGFYLEGEGLFQRAYNALANFWLQLHHDQGRGLPVAGNFGLSKIPAPPHFPFSPDEAFGGEEILLKSNLEKFGLAFHLIPELSVRHNGRKGAKGFFARAWRHGAGPAQKSPLGQALINFMRFVRKERGLGIKVLMISYMSTVFISRWLWNRKLPI